jgi:hypothetical protein
MLRYEPAWLIQQYPAERPVRPGIPYVQIGGPGPYRIISSTQPFRLQDTLGLSPKLDYDEPIARLASYDGYSLTVERALFSDGVKSNYAMDGPGQLRPLLQREYPERLPPLHDARLSNGIGTAVIVLDAEGKPYLPRRAPKQAVFPGGFHCTASGETVWTGATDFASLFTANICRELEEEAGLARADLDWIRPLALCREFLRGGKPQLFFAAGTSLGEEELRERRLAAIARQIERGRQEIMDERLAAVTPAALEKCTLECRANLALL